jgi:hypothetical protein
VHNVHLKTIDYVRKISIEENYFLVEISKKDEILTGGKRRP